MNIEDAFPNIKASYNDENHPFWGDNILGASIFDFLELIENQFEKSFYAGPDAFNELGEFLLKDILWAKKNATQPVLELLDFMQLAYGATCADFFGRAGMFSRAHDWLILSISDDIDYLEEFVALLNRLLRFYGSQHPFIMENVGIYHRLWMNSLFYYSRNFGGLKDLSKMILHSEVDKVLDFSKVKSKLFDKKTALELSCNMLAWAINNQETIGYPIAGMIEGWIPSLERTEQKLAYLQLATVSAQLTSKSPDFFAKQVMDGYSDLCNGHELLHAQAIYYMTNLEELEANQNTLDAALKMYSDSLSDLHFLDKKYEKARIFRIIRGLIVLLLKRRKVTIAIDIMADFYERPKNIRNYAELFIGLNFDAPRALYICRSAIVKSHEITVDEYMNMVALTNQFLSTNIMLNDAPDFVIQEPKRFGFPEKIFGNEWENQLCNYYEFKKIPESCIKNFNAMNILPGQQHPIQSLMIKAIGSTLPINSSFEIPKTYRKTKKVLLWSYGTLSSDREAELVSNILTHVGIVVEIADVILETKDTFLQKYFSDNYDLIWIATHGNFNHHLPHLSTISVLPDVEVTIKDLHYDVNASKQRLLFLNICDGATSSTSDSLYDNGFGAGLANTAQCVISHLWPVETEPALVYGAVFAHFISLKNNFWESFQMTIRLLNENNNIILDALTESNQLLDVAAIEQRLNEEINSNIYYWGSGVFYN